MLYANYQRNHVVFPGRGPVLYDFLDAELETDAGKIKHKWKHANNSNSEDALTWSCFDALRCIPAEKMIVALDEIMEDAYGNEPCGFSFADEKNVQIHIGKCYETTGLLIPESTETDASIETDSKLIFIEAKLYSSISLPDDKIPYNQIIKKLRVGLDFAHHNNLDFYFIFLDIAPLDKLLTFGCKAISASTFREIKTDNQPNGNLHNILADIPCNDLSEMTRKMGWLTWGCLFKTVLRRFTFTVN